MVFALMMIQCVKNFPASICSADMKYRIIVKQVTCISTMGISVTALAIQNAVGRYNAKALCRARIGLPVKDAVVSDMDSRR